MNKLPQFWQELKRRNVHRSLAIYAGSAFVILEASDMILPRLGLPGWVVDLVLYLLILGAAVTIIVSWIFDLTPDGIEKTRPIAELAPGEKLKVSHGWKIATYLSLFVVAGFIIYHLANGLRNSAEGAIQSLVILPFDNYTGNNEMDYIVSGMYASMIGDMSKISGLRIISKTSASNLNSRKLSIPEIAEELSVDAVIETMVTCVSDSICVQFRLIGINNKEELLWSGNYGAKMSDILNLNSWVIRDISNEIDLPLTTEQQMVLDEPRPVDPETYELYLKGKFNMGFLTLESQQVALDYFNQALARDSGFAEAYAGIAGVWVFMKPMGFVSPDEANPILERNIAKALELDSDNDEVLFYDGLKKIWTDFDYEAGEHSLRRCLEVNPNFSEAWAYLSHLMMAFKRPGEMKQYMEEALKIDPGNPLILGLEQVELMVLGNYDQCILESRKLQSMMPNNPLLMYVLFTCHTETGEPDLAIIELNKIYSQLANEEVIRILNEVYEQSGFQAALLASADAWTNGSEFVSAQHAMMLYAYGGNTEKLFFWLDRAYIRGDPSIPYIGVMPYLRPFDDHPRFVEILQRMNFPEGPFQPDLE